MSSAAQATANQANAQHSSGPRSITGKAASSQNALKHGLTAQTVVLPGEDEAAYLKMCEGMFADLAPEGEPERNLVQLLCDTQWRLHRCGRLEVAILTEDLLDHKGLDNISKHEARLRKQYSVTLKEAIGLIEARRRAEFDRMKEAMLTRRADKLKGTSHFQEIGFVFSIDRIDAAIRREDILTESGKVMDLEALAKVIGRPAVARQFTGK